MRKQYNANSVSQNHTETVLQYLSGTLETITIGAESIKEYAFKNNSKLTSITILPTVKSIGQYAFSGCGNLIEVIYKGTASDWRRITLSYNWTEGTQIKEIICENGVITL